MIQVNEYIWLDDQDIEIIFVQSSGPGGQNVNKVATRAQLRFNTNSPNLPEDVRQRLQVQMRNRINQDGYLVLEAGQTRSQEQNKKKVLERLVEILRRAARKPKHRLPTKPTLASRQKRLENKKHRSQIKRYRRNLDDI
jgi:ribosome-associated protein